MRAIVATVVLGACATRTVVVAPMMVGLAASDLREHGRARVYDLVAKGVGFLAIGALVGYCLAECQDEGSVGRAFGYTAAVGGGTALLFLLAAAVGGRD